MANKIEDKKIRILVIGAGYSTALQSPLPILDPMLVPISKAAEAMVEENVDYVKVVFKTGEQKKLDMKTLDSLANKGNLAVKNFVKKFVQENGNRDNKNIKNTNQKQAQNDINNNKNTNHKQAQNDINNNKNQNNNERNNSNNNDKKDVGAEESKK